MKKIIILNLVCAFFLFSCSENTDQKEHNTVPRGDPQFTRLTTSWVIDNVHVMKGRIVRYTSGICQKLQDDGIAEMVVLIQNKVRKPEDYATHYGRWLGLGKKGLSTKGGNNGIVWLIRPDAKERITISVGRGLPKFTSTDYGEIIDEVIDYINFGNFDMGVELLVSLSDKKLRSLYQGDKK